MHPDEIRSVLALNAVPGLAARDVRTLIDGFGDARSVVEASASAWRIVLGQRGGNAELYRGAAQEILRGIDEERRRVDKRGIRLFFAHQGPYPDVLRHLSDPPPVLYVWGDDFSAAVLEEGSAAVLEGDSATVVETPSAVAIIGSRRATYHGEKRARMLAGDLGALGIVTVSGLARGIDTMVHQGTLDSGGSTWAVVGSGLDHVYPPENRILAERIAHRGAVITEFSMATRPFPANFPRRNRLIAALSRATVVVEGKMSSGALITARLAADLGRTVMAVPGPAASPLTEAPHFLLRMGAALVESAADVIWELGLRLPSSAKTFAAKGSGVSLTAIQKAALDVLGAEPLPRDIVIERLGLSVETVARVLVELELAGLVKSVPGDGVLRA